MKKSLKKKKVLEYLTVFQEEKTGGFSVWVPELPGCASQGETFEEALRNIKEAIGLFLEYSEEKESTFPDYKKQFVIPVKIVHA